MMLSAVFMLIGSSMVSASDGSSQAMLVNIHVTDSPAKMVIDEIERQTDYLFAYSNAVIDLSHKVSIDAENRPVSEILDRTFANTDISYSMLGVNILLSSKASLGQNPQTPQSSDRVVRGVVRDEAGDPIVGAMVSVKDGTQVAITNSNGAYSINIGAGSDLLFSMLGYTAQSIAIAGRGTIDVTMQENATVLDATIVIGYGTTSARKTVSAISTMSTDKIDQLPYTSTAASLQGRVSGVLVQSADGQPGGNPPIISIRGGGTPLYVIDGVIRSADNFNALASSDIESINILKDASATAVYGAQAGNGIVLVTTKRGATGLNVEYMGGFDFSKPTTVADRVDAIAYAEASNAAARYDGRGEYQYYTQAEIDQIRNGTSTVYSNKDWYDEATRKTAPQHRHNITISGNNNGVNHFTSIGYLDQKSIYVKQQNNHYQKYSVRSNISSTFEKIGLDVGLNIDGTYEKRTPNPYGQTGIWNDLLGYGKAIDRIYNDDGTYSPLDIHPIVWLDERSGYDNNYRNVANVQAYLGWAVPWVKGLSAKLTGNSNWDSRDRKFFKSNAPQYSNGELIGQNRVKELQMDREWRRGNTLDFGIDYTRQFGKHFFELQGVYSYYDEYYETFTARRTGFISNDFDQLSAGDASTQTNAGSAAERTRIGYVGRVRYSFADRYSLEANFRYDGNDNFAPSVRWGFFPSAAVAWTISEESFMKPLVERGIINFAKARASYGQVGLDTDVNRFGYIPVYSFSAQSSVIGGAFAPGFTEGNLVSPEILSWYTKDAFDVGIDLVFLNNKLTATFDYYYYKTTGYLMSPTTSYTTTLGKSLPQIKSNSEHRRAGFEAAFRYRNNYRDFNYEVGVQFTTYNELWKTKADEAITDLMDPRKRINHLTLVYGPPIYENGVYKGTTPTSYYVNSGIHQDNASILNAPRPLTATELKRGDLSYQDVNGDGKIDSDDRIKMGKPFFPSFEYGIDFNFDYKGIFLYGLLQGTGNRTSELRVLYRGGNVVSSNYAFQMDSWTPDNMSARYPRSSALQSPNGGNNTLDSDFWMLNAKYFRLKSLQVGYDFKKVLFKNNRGISKFRLSLMGTNLFTISDTMEFFDPESYNFGASYPMQKTYSIVLNIGI